MVLKQDIRTQWPLDANIGSYNFCWEVNVVASLASVPSAHTRFLNCQSVTKKCNYLLKKL